MSDDVKTGRIFRMAELEDRLGISRSTISRMVKEGEFPRPVKLSKRAVGWRDADIDRWLRDRGERE